MQAGLGYAWGSSYFEGCRSKGLGLRAAELMKEDGYTGGSMCLVGGRPNSDSMACVLLYSNGERRTRT